MFVTKVSIDCIRKQTPCKIKNKIKNSCENKEDLQAFEELSKVKEKEELKYLRLQEKVCKGNFHYDARRPIVKTVEATSKKLLEESKPTTRAVNELNVLSGNVKSLEVAKK